MNLRDWRWKSGIAVIVFVALFLWGASAMAQDVEARIGLGVNVLDRDDRGTHITQDMMLLIDRDWYVQATRFGNSDFIDDSWRFSTGLRVEWRQDTNLEPYMRLGVAYWDEEPTWLVSERWMFDMAIGARLWRVAELEWQHNSTAGRAEWNTGVDVLTFNAVLRFW